MLISTIDLKNIADLKNAIINKLDLDTDGISLFVNGGLLLEEEKIIILRENDTVQIKYDKLSHSFCHNSSLTETQDRRLSLSAEKNDRNKVSKHSKKNKRSVGTNIQVVREYQNLSQHENSLDQFPLVQENTLNQLKVNSNDMEVDDQTLALNDDKCNGNKTLKHSKKHKSKTKDQELALQYETLPDSSVYSPSSVEVENNKLSISTENCNGNNTSKHSKTRRNRNEGSNLFVEEGNKDMNLSKKKRKRDVAPFDTFGENEIQIENSMLKPLFTENNTSSSKKNKSCYASTTKEVHVLNDSDNTEEVTEVPVVYDVSEIQIENSMLKPPFTENNTSSSKKNKYCYASTTKEVHVLNDSDNTEEVIEVPVVYDVSEIQMENSMLKPLFTENNTSFSKKNKSCYASTTKEVHVLNDSDNTEEVIEVPVVYDVSEIQMENSMLKPLFTENNTSSSKKNKSSYAKDVNVSSDSDNIVKVNEVPVVSDVSEKPKDTIHLKVNEDDNKPTDVSVDSSTLGSNCKKRKRNRKRNRKQKTDANLLGPFMSANISTFQNVPEDDSRALSPCDDYAGIRKHIRFTSPDRESTAKEMEPETNHSSSRGSPTKAILPPTPKGPTLHENIARATEIAKKNTSKFCTSPNSNCISASTKTPSLTASQLETTKELSPKPTLNSTTEALAEQILVDPNSSLIGENPLENSAASYTEYPLIKATPPMGAHIAFKLLELDENYSPVISDYKEGVIKSRNPKSEELEIELINVEIKPGRTGKFENLKEDEEPPEEVIEKVIVPWPSLIEPRLISQNSSK
ncbi:hypothetical protein JTE90_012825 [Oedothorax gibbosus]|uniref:Coilin tudor domain-containing protein n=1 Tax=Oedothorax gibbosus TaxID=931172 RepID=A0AAV6W353_9ARAC|nr:hypothetical protein JTE90_012825 [Oedothorax gibbosus]